LGSFAGSGFLATAQAAMPTFTNPNNVSIVTGAPPAVHGISGNYCLDRASGREIMMTDPDLMRSETILALLAAEGVKVAAVTAKDKLRRLLGRGLDGIAFSSEQADAGVEKMVGRPRPDMYSADLSLYVLDAGLRLLERGAVVGLVADHGMNDKPRVVFVEDELARRFGAGAARVICPITDPFVRHHGALGSFVRIYVRKVADLAPMMAACAALPGVARVLDREEAAQVFEMPADREADFVALGDAATALGAARAGHDLSALEGHPLRSHGGEGERTVPFILSHPLTAQYRERAATRPLHNYDIFDFALNGLAG
ncbi:MAG: alkaline phosphatase family protein, partial [Stellaceae bacterium]